MSPYCWALVALLGVFVLPWDPEIIPGPMPRNLTPTPADFPVDGPHYTRSNLAFPCTGEICSAWLFMPKNIQKKVPVLVMGHGLGGQKDFGFDRYGQMFSDEGIAVFAFDYRTFGGSSGEPRHWVSPKRHVQDWHSAVSYIQSDLVDKVDPSKIFLWGTSLAGGHALVTAGNLTDQIAGVVAQARKGESPRSSILPNFLTAPTANFQSGCLAMLIQHLLQTSIRQHCVPAAVLSVAAIYAQVLAVADMLRHRWMSTIANCLPIVANRQANHRYINLHSKDMWALHGHV